MKSKAWVMIPHCDKKATEMTIEIKPLVLCEDCKYYKDNGATAKCWLPCQDMSVPQQWFCASGEER